MKAPAVTKAVEPCAVKARLQSPKPVGDAVTRMKVVAEALGFDGVGMLEAFAQSWLDGLTAKASPNTDSPKPKPKPLWAASSAPVRLPARELVDTGGGEPVETASPGARD